MDPQIESMPDQGLESAPRRKGADEQSARDPRAGKSRCSVCDKPRHEHKGSSFCNMPGSPPPPAPPAAGTPGPKGGAKGLKGAKGTKGAKGGAKGAKHVSIPPPYMARVDEAQILYRWVFLDRWDPRGGDKIALTRPSLA